LFRGIRVNEQGKVVKLISKAGIKNRNRKTKNLLLEQEYIFRVSRGAGAMVVRKWARIRNKGKNDKGKLQKKRRQALKATFCNDHAAYVGRLCRHRHSRNFLGT
jgi:hypothetical protein